MHELIPSFRDSIFSPSIELTEELLETGVDVLLENEALKSIPIVGTISAICKVGYNLHERHLVKQTLMFINGVNSGSINREVLEKHKKELDENPKKAEKELGRIIFLLGANIEELQSKILGGFYRAYVKGAISWEIFCELSEANRRMFLSDYKILQDLSMKKEFKIDVDELYQVDRLISLGLLKRNNQRKGNFWEDADLLIEGKKEIVVTSFGKTFFQFMPKEDENEKKRYSYNTK